jgi:hypothetical protein
MEKQRAREIGLECVGIITKMLEKAMSREEYYIALIELHRKYLMPGHEPPLTPFQLKNYRMKMRVQDPDTKIVYEDCLSPFNFQESAEMFMRHQQRLDKEFPSLKAWTKKGELGLTELFDLDIEPKLPLQEATLFEKKREEVKSKIRYPKQEEG